MTCYIRMELIGKTQKHLSAERKSKWNERNPTLRAFGSKTKLCPTCRVHVAFHDWKVPVTSTRHYTALYVRHSTAAGCGATLDTLSRQIRGRIVRTLGWEPRSPARTRFPPLLCFSYLMSEPTWVSTAWNSFQMTPVRTERRRHRIVPSRRREQ